MIWTGKVINRWSENKFDFTNCKGCRKYGYANIRILCSTSLLKTLWEKEKLLVTSNFSISHSIFYLFRAHSAASIKFKIVVCKLFESGWV